MMTVLLIASQSPGYSELLLDGSRDHLVVKADRMPLSQIFDALGEKFSVRLKSPIPPDIQLGGHFSGSLTYVIRRLLQSYDFVLAVGQGGDIDSIVITVLGQKNYAAGNLLSSASFQPPTHPPRRGDGGM
jgi:hypothetical protein